MEFFSLMISPPVNPAPASASCAFAPQIFIGIGQSPGCEILACSLEREECIGREGMAGIHEAAGSGPMGEQ